MSNEATSLVSREHSTYPYSYETTSTLQTVVSAIQSITTTHVEQYALVTIVLQFALEDEKVHRHYLEAYSAKYYLNELRSLVRKTDRVYLLDSTFYFILPGANAEGGRIVESRLWDALLWCVHNVHEDNVLQPRIMTIGHAASSPTDENAHACITAASEPCYSFDTQPEIDTEVVNDSLQDNDMVMLDMEVISHEDELTALARKLGMPYLSLLPRKRPEQVQRLVTLKLAHELQCYPLGRERGTLTVALSNPQDSTVLARLHRETGLRIFPVLAHPQELQTALSLLV